MPLQWKCRFLFLKIYLLIFDGAVFATGRLLSLAAASGGCSLAAVVFRLLTGLVPAVVFTGSVVHTLNSVACGLGSCGWRAYSTGLVTPRHVGFSWIRWNPCLLPWEAGSLLLSHQGNQEVQT